MGWPIHLIGTKNLQPVNGGLERISPLGTFCVLTEPVNQLLQCSRFGRFEPAHMGLVYVDRIRHKFESLRHSRTAGRRPMLTVELPVEDEVLSSASTLKRSPVVL